MRRVMLLQSPSIFWLCGGTVSLSSLVYMGLVILDRQKYTAEPLVPEPSAFEYEMAIGKIKKTQITAELIKAKGGKIRYGIHKL